MPALYCESIKNACGKEQTYMGAEVSYNVFRRNISHVAKVKTSIKNRIFVSLIEVEKSYV